MPGAEYGGIVPVQCHIDVRDAWSVPAWVGGGQKEGGRSEQPPCRAPMLVFYITVPLMVVAVVIAVIPVERGSFRHDRQMHAGSIESGSTADQEVEFWHRLLGRRGARPRIMATPGMVDDSEIRRVGVEPERIAETGSGQSIVRRND